MTTGIRRFLGAALVTALAVAALVAALGGATAHEGHDHGAATPAASPAMVSGDLLSTGVVYLAIHNDGKDADRLIGAKTSVAQVVEIHEMKESNGMAVMMPVEGGVEIPAGGEAKLEPSGVHLMLVGLTESLYPNTEYELTLSFEHAGEVTITVPVQRDAPEGDAVKREKAGDLTIEGAWSRPAPKLDSGATPAASPASHHGH